MWNADKVEVTHLAKTEQEIHVTIKVRHSLTVTSSPSDDRVSLNNVDITPFPIFDDGFLIIYGIRSIWISRFEPQNPVLDVGFWGPIRSAMLARLWGLVGIR